jgi:hypothetical protein
MPRPHWLRRPVKHEMSARVAPRSFLPYVRWPYFDPERTPPMLTTAELRKRLDQTSSSLEGLRRYL